MNIKHLNEAEQLVANELLRGRQSQEIAEMVHISHSTVKFHLTNIYHKMGVKHDRAFLARDIANLQTDLERLNQNCISISLHQSRMQASDERIKQLELELSQLKNETKTVQAGSLPLGSNSITGI